jgi:peptidyl-prolyl cis-trans isomerase SurA
MHRHPLFLFVCVLSLGLGAACRSTSTPPAQSAASADTWAVVDGREIKRADVDRAYQRSGNAAQGLAEEEILAAKLSLLDDLILQDILIAKAGPLKVEVADSELTKAFDDAKRNIPDEAFQQELTKRGVTVADMREGLRRELLAQKVIEHEVTSKVTVTAQEVSDFFLANRSQFNLTEEAYHLAQIVVTPVREQQVANRTGDDATTPQAAAEKVKMLMERLKAGANFAELAMGYSEDPETAPRGGDLGLVPISRLKQAPPQLQAVVLKKTAGTVNVASMGGAHTLVLVVAHEQAGQRDLSTPGVSDRITEALKARKEQLLRAAYLTAARSDADVDNHLARRIVETQGKLPGGVTAAAGAPAAAAPPEKK